MAINFGSDNTSRRYTVPDNAAFTLNGSGSWTWLVVFKPNYANTDAKYIISTGGIQAANSYNMLLGGSTGNFGVSINTDALVLTASPPASGTNYLGYSRNISGTVRHGFYNLSTQAAAHTSNTSHTTSDGTSLVFGARSDFDLLRHYRGSISWIALLNKGLSDAELANLAAGTDILMSVHSPNVVALWDMSTSSASTITDIVGGFVATKVGTGYGPDEADVLPFQAVKGVTLTLHIGATPVSAMTNVQVAFFDQPHPQNFLTPTFTAGNVNINAQGELTVDVSSGTTLNVGQDGFIIIYKLDTNNHENSPAFAGRVTVTQI